MCRIRTGWLKHSIVTAGCGAVVEFEAAALLLRGGRHADGGGGGGRDDDGDAAAPATMVYRGSFRRSLTDPRRVTMRGRIYRVEVA